MSIQVFSARQSDERQRWLKLWEKTHREPFAHPTFVELFAGNDGEPMLAHLATPDHRVLFPFILKPIPNSGSAYDYTSPYGYGGPFESSDGTASGGEFWNSFDDWCSRSGVVAGFTRMSLFSECTPPDGGGVAQLFGNVVVNLERSQDAIWEGYARKVRKNVRRARESGLEVVDDPSGAQLDAFLEIYEATMTRREARSDFFFGRDFFQRIVQEMQGSYNFVHVMNGTQIVSTELVLKSTQYLYSFLGGTLDRAFDLRPNDLLKHHVIASGQELGLRGFVLGGGYGGEDGIFRYKLAFDPQGVVPFRVIRRVLNASRVDELVANRIREDLSWSPSDSFFPPYRA